MINSQVQKAWFLQDLQSIVEVKGTLILCPPP